MRRMIALAFVAILAMAASAPMKPSVKAAGGSSPYVDPSADLIPGVPNSVRMTCENKKCGGFDWCIVGTPNKICDFSGGLGHCVTRNC